TGTLSIAGTPQKPEGAGHFALADATLRGFPLGSVSADARLAGGSLLVTDLHASGEGIEVRGGGSIGLVSAARRGGAGPAPIATITRTSPLRFSLAVTEFDLKRLNAQTAPYVELAGNAKLSEIEGSGTLGKVQLTGKLAV